MADLKQGSPRRMQRAEWRALSEGLKNSGADAGNPVVVASQLASIKVDASSEAALAAYTRVGDVITADAVGALAAVDGVTLITGERLLLKNGAAGADDGVYDVTEIGDGATAFVLTRPKAFTTGVEGSLPGMLVTCHRGTANAGATYQVSNSAAITVNTTTMTFVETSNAATLSVIPVRVATFGLAAAGDQVAIADTDENDFASLATFASVSLAVGDIIEYEAYVETVSANATPQLVGRVRLGGDLVSSIVIADATNGGDDILVMSGRIHITAIGAAAVAKFNALNKNIVDFAGTVTVEPEYVHQTGTALDTTAAVNLTVSTQWNASHGSNIADLRSLVVRKLRDDS